MFIGEYTHSIDEKGRVSIPVRFREELAKGLVLTRGLDNCLWIYPTEEWNKLAEGVANLPITQKNARSFARFILSGAMELKVDRAGRINLPKYLNDYATIKNKVVICGMHNRLEVWANEKWESFKSEMENNSEEVAENLSDLGF